MAPGGPSCVVSGLFSGARPDGTFPGGVAIGKDDAICVSNFSVAPADGEPLGLGSRGEVLRFSALP